MNVFHRSNDRKNSAIFGLIYYILLYMFLASAIMLSIENKHSYHIMLDEIAAREDPEYEENTGNLEDITVY